MIFDKNTWIVVSREYLTRVKKKSFLLTTFLTPLAFVLFIVVLSFLLGYRADKVIKVGVLDEGSGLSLYLEDSKYVEFIKGDWTKEMALEEVEKGAYEGLLVLPFVEDSAFTRIAVRYFSDEKLDLENTEEIEKQLKEAARNLKIEQLSLDMSKVDLLKTKVSVLPERIHQTDDQTPGPTSMTSYIASGIGFTMGILMYFIVFFNGARVMQSVMEEKTNRIVEVMISSVRPFQLMMGKIIGVGMVGMTQFLLWILLIPILLLVLQPFLGIDSQVAQPQGMSGAEVVEMQEAMEDLDFNLILAELFNLNWWLILPMFVFYFLMGYLLYATLFAAVGSAIGDDIQEGQSLTLPISIPVIIAFYIMISTLKSPNSALAVWSSIFPLFSPIVMPARLAYDPPIWQLIASSVLLVAFVILMVWLTAKIYRVGILMYGKKASFKELWKWIYRSS
jgi:ABC-2 type transport system permease protein